MRKHRLLPAIAVAALTSGCAIDGTSQLTTSSIAPVAERGGHPTRALKGEPTRVFVFVGLDASCRPIAAHEYVIEAAPAQGRVTFQSNQDTTVQYSLSGKCIGKRATGTAVYYTPASAASGTDAFSVAARLANGERVVRQFKVAIPD